MSGVQPTGTVTFVFTDIEDSTGLWEREPVAMQQALADHDRLTAETFEADRGYVFAATGDGFAAGFDDAASALRSAVGLQRAIAAHAWPLVHPLRVRIGLHTGVATERSGNFFGPVVNAAARVMGLAAGGQVLVTGTTAGLLSSVLDDVELRPAGEHALRGMEHPIELLVVSGAELIDVVRPAEQAAIDRSDSLPRYATSFVGRDEELNQLVERLGAAGLVTLLGPGGMGKTRLAVEATRQASGEARTAWFVDLASVARGDAVLHETAAVVGAPAPRGGDPVDAIVDTLRPSDGVLVLDNCEHVLAAASELAHRLTTGCGELSIVATSRSPLGLAAEDLLHVAPLDAASAGAQLFSDRARGGDVDVSDAALRELCKALDGMPLAIELAAAQARFLSPAELLEQLDDRFELLRSTAPDHPDRHQSIEATVQASYDRLDADAKRLLNSMSVFAGAVELDMLDRFWTAIGESGRVAQPLAALVDNSLAIVSRDGGRTQFRMLETIRAFGRHRLEQAGELDAAAVAHAEVIARSVISANERAYRPGYEHFFDEIMSLWPEIRAAVDVAVRLGMSETACDLLWDLGLAAQMLERHELVGWVDQALTIDGIENDDRVTGLHAGAGLIGWTRAHFESAERRWQIVKAAVGDSAAWNPTIAVLPGLTALVRQEFDTAMAEKLESLALAAHHDDEFSRLMCHAMASMYAAQGGRSDDASTHHAIAAAGVEAFDNAWMTTFVRFAECQAQLDDAPERALEDARFVAGTARSAGLTWLVATASNYLAAALVRVGRLDEALDAIETALERLQAGGGVQSVQNTARNAVVLLERESRSDLAAPIVGWLTSDPVGIPGTPGMREHAAGLRERLPDLLGSDTAEELLHRGEQATLDEVVELIYSAATTLRTQNVGVDRITAL